jgi:hypothetical protein
MQFCIFLILSIIFFLLLCHFLSSPVAIFTVHVFINDYFWWYWVGGEPGQFSCFQFANLPIHLIVLFNLLILILIVFYLIFFLFFLFLGDEGEKIGGTRGDQRCVFLFIYIRIGAFVYVSIQYFIKY